LYIHRSLQFASSVAHRELQPHVVAVSRDQTACVIEPDGSGVRIGAVEQQLHRYRVAVQHLAREAHRNHQPGENVAAQQRPLHHGVVFRMANDAEIA
jgi:hypothetical protein